MVLRAAVWAALPLAEALARRQIADVVEQPPLVPRPLRPPDAKNAVEERPRQVTVTPLLEQAVRDAVAATQ